MTDPRIRRKEMIHETEGGVCAARGFQAGAVRCGIKASSEKDDTAVIWSERR